MCWRSLNLVYCVKCVVIASIKIICTGCNVRNHLKKGVRNKKFDTRLNIITMPAVRICDPVTATLCRTLENSQPKTSDDLSTSLVSSASRILQSEIQYKEVDDYQTTILDQLKAKYIVLSLPNSENSDDKPKDGTTYVKRNERMVKGPSLPEPTTTLYSPKKISLGWKGTFPVGAGMYNVGNTCYLNSTLQALFHVPALVNWLLSDTHHTSKCEQNDGGGECLTCAVAKTLQFSHQKSGCAIKPFYIYNKLKLICRTMVPGQQEDAHEFLRYLLEGMEKAYLARHKAGKLDSYSKETTPINQIFGGYIRTEVKCLQCRHVSTTFQHFQDLLVDIRKASTLDEALSSYFSREQLDNNDYKCEACKRRVPATKQFSLERPPKVLCVQLKRFSVLGGKISKHIGFKQTIDMGPYLWREPGEPTQPLTYKLMSIVTHMGPSVNCGHYTAVAKVSTGQYYSFDDSCVRPISLSNVLSTNAYIMIFEMEQQTQTQVQNQQTVKLNGTLTVNNTLSSPGSPMNKTINPKPSTSGLLPLNGSVNGTSITKDITENSEISSQTSASKSTELPCTMQKGTNFIGPLLPQKLQDKTQPRLIMHIKNGKILNGNSLVPYDGSSEEEDIICIGALKNNANSNTPPKTNVSSSGTNGMQKGSPIKNNSPKTVINSKDMQKSALKTNGSSISQNQTNITQCTKIQNGSSCSTITSLIKYQNGQSEVNSKTESSSNKTKWHQSVRAKVGQDEKVITKAASSSMKGWQVSKDTFSPTSAAVPNGWSVTDKEDINKGSQNNTTPSAAALRDFNGTNRSETVSHLLKMSHRGYGSSSVSNWNGNRTHLDREIDNDRREERKRHFNTDDEELDRGRVKKVKDHRTYEERSNTGYNPFQEYQNGKTWNRSINDYYRRHYYNTSSYTRQRHGRNYRPSHYRYNNHSRAHWQRG
ncbi:ubiquitin carboxyl-terminal hydrolase 36-like isoform X2 [Hylaeus volcanicus]|uniref:ubiquitin carboxyl-terminal hydrolase 36-like isoform X2 n=1 Tax=Hylaeus volcanicus TaxID=313075 RepID=UPI0023B780EA|nr:ubiquitin carboxyl-terminal hydrolase 36-like isoform X2 [Hylaeus volcanicus]